MEGALNSIRHLSISSRQNSSHFRLSDSVLDEFKVCGTEEPSTTAARSPRVTSVWSATPEPRSLLERDVRMCVTDEDTILSVPTPDLVTSLRGPGWAVEIEKAERAGCETQQWTTSGKFHLPRPCVTESPPVASVPTPEFVTRGSGWAATAPSEQQRAARAAEDTPVKSLAALAAARQQFVWTRRRGGPDASGAATHCSYSFSSSDDSSSSSSSSGGSDRTGALRRGRQWAGDPADHEERTARRARMCHYQDAADPALDVATPEPVWRELHVATAAAEQRDIYPAHAIGAYAAASGAAPPPPALPGARGALAAAAAAPVGSPALDMQMRLLEASLRGELRALGAKLDATLIAAAPAPPSTTTSARRGDEGGAIVIGDDADNGANAAAAVAVALDEASVRSEMRGLNAKLDALLGLMRQLPLPRPASGGGGASFAAAPPSVASGGLVFTNPSINMA